jgi:hypothetical protein
MSPHSHNKFGHCARPEALGRLTDVEVLLFQWHSAVEDTPEASPAAISVSSVSNKFYTWVFFLFFHNSSIIKIRNMEYERCCIFLLLMSCPHFSLSLLVLPSLKQSEYPNRK